MCLPEINKQVIMMLVSRKVNSKYKGIEGK